MALHYTPSTPVLACTDTGDLWLIASQLPSAVTRRSATVRPTVMRPSEYLCHLSPYKCTTWVVRDYGPGSAPGLAGAMRRVHLAIISEFSVQTYKLEIAPKSWGSPTEIGKIPTGKTGV
jgi:hypothetical protein